MSLTTFTCNYLTPLHFKGLTIFTVWTTGTTHIDSVTDFGSFLRFPLFTTFFLFFGFHPLPFFLCSFCWS